MHGGQWEVGGFLIKLFNLFRFQGSFHLVASPANSVDTVTRRLESAIRSQNPRSMTVQNGVITFTGGLFRIVNGSNRLTQISTGSIVVKESNGQVQVYYQLRLGGVLVAFTLTSLILGLVIWGVAPTSEGFLFWGFISVLTFVLQYLKVTRRFPAFLHRRATS